MSCPLLTTTKLLVAQVFRASRNLMVMPVEGDVGKVPDTVLLRVSTAQLEDPVK